MRSDPPTTAAIVDEGAAGAGLKLDVLAEFACPFCSRAVTLGRVRGSGAPAAVHAVPTCSRYDELDPAEFATACRRAAVGEVADA